MVADAPTRAVGEVEFAPGHARFPDFKLSQFRVIAGATAVFTAGQGALVFSEGRFTGF